MVAIHGPVLALLLGAALHICVQDASATENIYGVETRLRGKLLDTYDKRVRPAENATIPVNVKTRIYLYGLTKVDPQKDVITLEVILVMTWNDTRLKWDPTEFLNISQFNLPINDIWAPDVSIYNSMVQPRLSNEDIGYAEVQYNGRARIAYFEEVQAGCRMDIHNFPFDVQKCYLTYGTWYHFSGGVTIDSNVNMTGYWGVSRHNDWEVLNGSLVYVRENSNAQTFMLELRRRPAFYLYMYVAPPVVVSLLTPFTFLLHNSEIQRSSLGMGIILSMTFLTGSFSWLMPSGQGAMPKLGMYYTGSLITAVFAYMISVAITAAAERSAKLSGPPAVATRVIGDYLGSLLCVTRTLSGGVTLEGDTEAARAKVTDTKDESQEWTHLARVLDRIFFIVFTLIFVIMAMACLI